MAIPGDVTPPRTGDLVQRVAFHSTFWLTFHALTFGLSFRASGRGNIPATGPVLLVSNHQSFLDPWLVGNASTRWLVYLARHNLFKNRLFAAAIRSYGAVPIDRGFGKEGLQTVLGLLGQGRAIVIFPEGERTHDGTVQPLKPGISLLIKRANCQIVPVGISGCYDMWSRHAKRPQPETLFGETGGRSIGLHYGEPVHSGVYRTMDRDAMLADLQARIAVSVTEAEKLRRRA